MVSKWKKVSFDPQAHLRQMVEKVATYARSRQKYVAGVEGYQTPDGAYMIYVESPSHFHYDLPRLFKDDKYFHHIRAERKEGSYDWASDTYFKDCDVMHFELKP